MKKQWLLFILVLALLPVTLRAAPQAADKWYVVLFVVNGCPYCKMMREQVIDPMIATGEIPPQQFYEINMTNKSEWFYFDPMDTYLQKRDLYKRYDLGLFPTTVILDKRANLLSPKLVGITTPEKFRQKLKAALDQLEKPDA